MNPRTRAMVILLIAGAVLLITAMPAAAYPDRNEWDRVSRWIHDTKEAAPGESYLELNAYFIAPCNVNFSSGALATPPPAPGAAADDGFTRLSSMLDRGIRLMLRLVSAHAVTAPVPGAAFLLGAGGLCLFGLRRRDRSQA
ncbi:MAG: hypothetical protein AB1346_14340 [Thermodesulfobacteriota bacterium]